MTAVRRRPAGRRLGPRAQIGEALSRDPYVGRGAPVWAQASLILAISIVFGFQFVTFKEAFHAVGPWTMLTLRAALSIPVLLAVMRWARVPLVAGRAELIRIAVPATLLMASQGAFTIGVHRLSAGLTSTIVSMAPIFSLVLGFAFRVERAGLIGLVGAGTGVAGVAIATGAASGRVDTLGVLVLLACNVAYSCSLISLKGMRTRVSPGVYMLVSMVESVLVYTPVAIVAESFRIDWAWLPLLSMGYISIAGNVFAYIGVMFLLRRGGVFQSSLTTPLIPVFAILFAVLLLGEPLLGRELVGGGLIVGGVLLAITPASRLRALHPGRRRGSIGR